MIDRYSLDKMKSIWQEEFKFKTMLAIEILALQAYASRKIVPPAAVKRIQQKARFNLKEIQKIEAKTQHDI
jgi:adenylosuccinate lyase